MRACACVCARLSAGRARACYAPRRARASRRACVCARACAFARICLCACVVPCVCVSVRAHEAFGARVQLPVSQAACVHARMYARACVRVLCVCARARARACGVSALAPCVDVCASVCICVCPCTRARLCVCFCARYVWLCLCLRLCLRKCMFMRLRHLHDQAKALLSLSRCSSPNCGMGTESRAAGAWPGTQSSLGRRARAGPGAR